MLLETDAMADELKDLRIPVMMAATEVAAIDEWRRKQEDLPGRSEAIRRLIESGLSNDTEDLFDDSEDDSDDESNIAPPAVFEDNVLYGLARFTENARVIRKILKTSALDREAATQISTAIDGVMRELQFIKSIL